MDASVEHSHAPAKWDVNDLLALTALGALAGPYVPWNVWSMRPGAVATVVNDIVLNHRTVAVELGGGASTAYLGRALRETGGRLVTIEQDAAWCAALARRLDREELGDVVRVVHAPLAPLDPGPEWPANAPARWYDTATLERTLPDAIEVLLVDGPAAAPEPETLVRYPAIPLLRDRLAEDCLVVLDDADRDAEAATAAAWSEELGLPCVISSRTGLAALRRGRGIFAAL